MSELHKAKLKLKSHTLECAKKALNTKEVKWVLADINRHFKQHSWGLCFESYKEFMKVDSSVALVILDKKGYTVKIDWDRFMMFIIPQRRK